MTKTFAVAAAALALVLALVPATPIQAGGPAIDGSVSSPAADLGSALVQLTGDPVSTAAATKSNDGKKIDLSSTKVKSYRAQLSALRNDFKQWLRTNAPAARVTGEFDISLNAVGVSLNGTPLATIQSAPMVLSAQYQLLYHPLGDPDLALIHAIEAWGAGGGANAGVKSDGSRVKVGIIDTGIDVTHPCFNDSGYATTPRQGPASLTNNKVIVAKVFYNKADVRGLTPAAVQEHGTHVAGTVGCNYGLTNSTTTVDGVSVSYGVLGVAPGVLLGNYNVFPGDVSNSRSEDILNALEAAYADGMDIVNLSLGGSASGVQDLLTMAIDDLDQAGMISAVAAGNEGPGHHTISSPGSAARALTAGAMTVGHFIASPVTVGGNTYGAATGDFATVTADLTAPLGVVLDGTSLSQACSALPAASLANKIALISRGTCTFSTKIRNAETAGAVATLVVNNTGGDPVGMAQDGTPNQPTRPAYMVGQEHRAALIAANGQSTTIGATKTYFQTANSNIMAAFSSQGPTDVDFRVKPDVVAPGVNVLSSIPASFCAAPPCWAFFQGTSMATPHLAGSAAVVFGQHPTWSAAQVRSAIVNTADQGILKTSSGAAIQSDPNVIGAGRDNVLSAVNAKVALAPVSLSFGSVPAGAGQTRTATISLSTLNGPSASSVAVTGTTGTGITYTATVSGSTITVTMNAAKGASRGDHQAVLRVMAGGSEIAHAVLYTFAK
jgi:minor extracellular serine protease Vpr